MRYLILTILLALLSRNISDAQAGARSSISDWGRAIFDSKPSYSVTDPQNIGSDIIISITSKHFREKEIDSKKYQIGFTITKTTTYSNLTYTVTQDSTIQIDQWYINGEAIPSAWFYDFNYPIWRENYKRIFPMIESEFREKYTNLLPSPLQDWEIKSLASTIPTLSFSGQSITVTQTTYATRQANYLGQTLKISYQEVKTTLYDLVQNTVNTNVKIEGVKGFEINLSGIDIPWNIGTNNLLVHLNGQKDVTVSQPSPPVKHKAPIAPPPFTDNIIIDQTIACHFNSRNDFRKKYQDLYWQYIHRPVFTITANYTPSYAYRSNHVVEQQFTHSADQQSRSTTEDGRYGQIFELHLGGTWSRTHTWYIGYTYLQNGFKQSAKPGGIDWSTGLNNAAFVQNGYRFEHHGFSLGYNYTGYSSQHLASGIFDGNLFYLFGKQPSDDGLRKNQFGVKLSAGISLRPNYYWDFHFMPTFLYDISSINKGSVLRSNLFNIGITAGVTIRSAFSWKTFKLKMPD